MLKASPKMKLHGGVSVLLLTLLLCLLLSPVRSAVLSIDLGSEWMKVAVVNIKPGQSPISIAINEMSKRKSPSLVAFSNGDMLVGEAASGISARYPERVYSQLHNVVGKPFQSVKQFLDSQYLPYDIVEDQRGAAGFRIDDGSIFSSEELLAFILSYAKSLGETHAKTVIKDAVIAVPPYLGQAERECLVIAAELGGLNVLSLINQHSGVALQYGINKEFSDGPKDVLFYDMGSGCTYAALVHYSTYVTKEYGKEKAVNQFQVKEVKWDSSLGGYQMELRMLEYFADIFNKEIGGGLDIRKFPKAMAKLKKQVKRTKEILSANTEAMLSVEALYDDRDFRATITRKKFEELCDDLWQQALVPIREVLSSSGLSVEKLHAVELIGGATRVPKLQTVLSDFFGDKGLDRHLDADEAIALGSALHAANLTDGIKMNRRLGMVDGVTYSILGDFEDEGNKDLIVPRFKKLPSKVFKPTKHINDFKFSLFYDSAEKLPPGLTSSVIASYEVSGVTEAYNKHASRNLTNPIKTNLHFSLSRSGVLSIDRADTVVEFSEWTEVPVKNQTANQTKPTLDKNETKSSESSTGTEANSSESEDAEISKTSETANNTKILEPEIVMEKKLRKRTIRVPLKIKDVSVGVIRPMSKDARLEAVARLDKINRQEDEKRKTAEAKNSLESYIYVTKEKLDSVDGLDKVTTEEQRNVFREELTDAEDWLYAEETTALEYQKKLKGLKSIGDAMFFRLSELEARPAAVKKALEYVETVKDTVEQWSTTKPWISDTAKKELLESVNGMKKWLSDKQAEQDQKPAHESPVFSSEDVYSKIVKIDEKFSKLGKTPKPKPPKVEEKPTKKVNESASGSKYETSDKGSESFEASDNEGSQQQQSGASGEPIDSSQIEAGVDQDETKHDEL